MKRPAAAVALAVDHGPSIRRDRGDVVLIERPDIDRPNAPNVRGAQRFDPLLLMLKADKIDAAHWAAAERFREDCALADGVRSGQGGGTPAWARTYLQRQLDAVTARREAIQAVGPRLSSVFLAVVAGHMALRQAARECRVGDARIAGMVREALEVLARHYSGGLGR